MDAEAKTPEPNAGVMAGQPITFGGVAAFTQASWRRLFIVQAVVAGGGVAAVLILLLNAWLPAFDAAVDHLPDNGYILRGELAWPTSEAVQLTDSRWLTIIVAPMNTHEFGKSADFQIEFQRKEARLYSMFGYMQFPYNQDFSLQMSHPDAVPWWGARRPFFIAGAAVGTFVGLWVTWMMLALLYLPFVKFIAFWTNRELGIAQAIRLGAAALLTPAIVFSVAIALYGLGWMPLTGLIGFCVLHAVMGWVYCAGGTMRLRRRDTPETSPAANPFNGPETDKPAEKPAQNPFKNS